MKGLWLCSHQIHTMHERQYCSTTTHQSKQSPCSRVLSLSVGDSKGIYTHVPVAILKG